MRFFTLIASLLAMFVSASAHATPCAELVRIANDEVKALIAVIKAPEADEFDQILAVETLTCAERKTIRDLAFRAMLRSPNDIVRTDAVFRALADRASIIVNRSTEQGMSKEALKFVKTYPQSVYDVRFVDPAKRCLSFYHKDKCAPAHALIVTRNEIVLRYDHDYVYLQPTPDGRLTGTWSNRGLKNIPAEIEVY